MEQSRIHTQLQYNSPEHGNQVFHPALQAPMLDHMSSINTSTGAPGISTSEVKPVLNYSIQTGEEFALEFMRDRVNPKKPFIPSSGAESNYATGYMELKGILGISHTGSESGSGTSMVTHGYSSSGASEGSSSKMKALCSFGGKILPRPSDRKLRYVGGETRIIRIRKDISWQELKQKILDIYDQTDVIKYQLPGEDFDALVSVSCDEDLQNMMEECNELENRESSQKLRMFLFSLSDLEYSQFGLGSVHGDSEVQYVVAINGMDGGSGRGSTRHGLASSSENNLDELDGNHIDKEITRAARDFTIVSTSPFPGIMVSSSTFQSSQPILPTSSTAYETHPQFYQGQVMHHKEADQYPFQYGTSSYFGEFPSSAPPNGFMNHHERLAEAQPYNGLQQQKSEMLVNELRVKPEGSVHQEDDFEKAHPLEMGRHVPSQPLDGKMKKRVPPEEKPDSIPVPEGNLTLLPPKYEAKQQEPDKGVPHVDTANPVLVPKSTEDDQFSTSSSTFGHGYADSESSHIDLSCHGPRVSVQRVYYSERLTREQVELLKRFSKSDDSLGSQFLISHSPSGVAPRNLNTESVEKLQDSNSVPYTEESVATAKPAYMDSQTIEDGLARLQKYKEFADAIFEINSKPSEEVLGSELKEAVSNPVDSEDNASPEGQVASTMHLEASASKIPKVNQGHVTAKAEAGDIIVDVDDRIPRDFLSDLFYKEVISEGSSAISPLHNDGGGLSLNMENYEPKHWSYFQKLAQEFGEKDVSVIDQDNRQYQFMPTDGISLGKSQHNFGEHNQKDLPIRIGADSAAMLTDSDQPPLNSESTQFDAMMANQRTQESEYEDGKLAARNMGLPPLDPSLGDFDISTLQSIKNEDLEELRELGSGTFGTVYHGKWRGTDVAIKRIKKSCFTGRSSEQEKLTIEFWREADILSKLHHPNVVAFYGVVQDGPGGTLATVAEYMVDGSLRHALLRKDRHLDRRKRLIIAMDAAFGMEYLHAKNIVHFDLKCDNLLVNLKDPSRPICKVGDFGLSKIKRNTLVSGGVRGTLPWMAPELLNGGSNKVSEKVDVFSFGIVLWEILTREEPYANMHYGAIIGGIVHNTLRPTIPSYCDPEWRRLMEECWEPEPAARPSFTEIASRLRTMLEAAKEAKAYGHKASK
ncbi:hypothetical protein SLEP1_g38375 [Rubroshorea leprosula]|nr:hypothetical protein SLEP1_g38375 [Rubroshorea leprosula]